jgi:parvulin-like peptidyl-prolyl isomerase
MAQPPDKERKALERLIDMEVLLLGARERGLENDFEVKNTLAQKEQELLLDELYRRGVLRGEDQVDNDKARAYFDRHRIGTERRLSRILVNHPMAIDQVFSRTHAGEDFAALASEISEDGETAMQGGDIGWMSRLSFKSHILRRQVFAAEVGELIGPIQEPDGFSVMKIVAEREVPFENVVAVVKQVMIEQKHAIATFAFLEGLAERAQIQEHGETLQLLLARLSEAGKEQPEFKKGERRLTLFTVSGGVWTLDNFMSAMLSERELAEIRTIDDLRLYARRLYSFKFLLPQYGREQGLHETESVAKELERTHREVLLKRLRDTEVIERIEPRESDERAYYEAHRERYTRPERTSIIEVLVDGREQAEELRKEMEKDGDLDELARRYSKRSTRIRRAGGRMQLLNPDKYGSLGWEAKDAQVGDIVGPIKTLNGYSVFKVLKKIPAQKRSFDESIGRVRAHLREDLGYSMFDELLIKLKKQYAGQIQIYEANLSGAKPSS